MNPNSHFLKVQSMLEWLCTGMVAHKASGAANASESTDSDGMVADRTCYEKTKNTNH
jgi:hypothetical protein